MRTLGTHTRYTLRPGGEDPGEQVVRVSVKVDGKRDRDDQVYGIINGSVDVNARRGQEAGVPFVLRGQDGSGRSRALRC